MLRKQGEGLRNRWIFVLLSFKGTSGERIIYETRNKVGCKYHSTVTYMGPEFSH
jgi:hypothetical protein